jgi:hypothetical protein
MVALRTDRPLDVFERSKVHSLQPPLQSQVDTDQRQLEYLDQIIYLGNIVVEEDSSPCDASLEQQGNGLPIPQSHPLLPLAVALGPSPIKTSVKPKRSASSSTLPQLTLVGVPSPASFSESCEAA